MRFVLRSVPASRLPTAPRWVIAVVVAWGALVAGAIWIARKYDADFVLCQFKRLTSRPCPGCGSTRGVLALIEGRPIDAWLWNPLVMSALAVLASLTLLRAVTAKRLVLDLDGTARALLLGVGILAVAANWLWLWDRA